VNYLNKVSNSIINSIKKGGKLLICGNGGSAAQAMHFAAELIGKYQYGMLERRGLPAIALTANVSSLTAISNDWGFDYVFSRQVEALGNKGDILFVISTSGKSRNCLEAVKIAREKGLEVIDLARNHGKTAAEIQEYQLKLIHQLTGKIEKAFL